MLLIREGKLLHEKSTCHFDRHYVKPGKNGFNLAGKTVTASMDHLLPRNFACMLSWIV